LAWAWPWTGAFVCSHEREETRTNLADRANDLANSARETYEHNRDRVQRAAETIRSTAESAMGQVGSASDVTMSA